jgi:hypothetical protein
MKTSQCHARGSEPRNYRYFRGTSPRARLPWGPQPSRDLTLLVLELLRLVASYTLGGSSRLLPAIAVVGLVMCLMQG